MRGWLILILLISGAAVGAIIQDVWMRVSIMGVLLVLAAFVVLVPLGRGSSYRGAAGGESVVVTDGHGIGDGHGDSGGGGGDSD